MKVAHRLKKLSFTCLLLIASYFSMNLFFASNNSIASKNTYKHSKQSDAYMENVSGIILNTAGTPTMKIKSPKMIHYKHQDTTHLERPKVTLFRKTKRPWEIVARTGVATDGINKITFNNNVIVKHLADKTHPKMTLKTESLTVLPNTEEAVTKEAVTINQPGAIIHATGMKASLKKGTIHLLAKTRSEYAPAQ